MAHRSNAPTIVSHQHFVLLQRPCFTCNKLPSFTDLWSFCVLLVKASLNGE